MLRLAPLAAAAGAAASGAGGIGKDKCDPTPCLGGACADGCCWDTVLHRYPLNVSAWDSAARRYVPVGTADAWYAWDESEPVDPVKNAKPHLGTFMHGPHLDPDGAPGATPPTYVSATAAGKVYLFDSFAPDMSSAKKKLVAYTDAPSTQYNVKSGGKLTSMLVADGAPFWVAPAENSSWWLSRGGVHVVKDDQCLKIFPDKADDPLDMFSGRVVNTVDCHEDSGICFFSAWKYSGTTTSFFPDCLHWCALDDMRDPTRCVAGGVVVDEAGEKICHNSDSGVPGGGGVHGFTIGRQGKGASAALDLFLVYTGGKSAEQEAVSAACAATDEGCAACAHDKEQTTCGVSWVRKVAVDVVRAADPAASTVTVRSSAPWGMELWNDTVANHSIADVGCDHAWMDATEEHMWVSTFRKVNDGMHMLDYDSGKLIYSITGHAKMKGWSPDMPEQNGTDGKWYSYTAGCHGRGSLGSPGSMLSFATSESYPLGMYPVPGWHGKGSVFWVDISQKYPTAEQARGR